MPIQNASDTPLDQNPGTLPNMQSAMLDWFQNLTFTQIKKSTVNFQLVEVETQTSFQGVRQPFTAQQLEMKPQGERKWKWEWIHAFPDLVLDIDDIIIFKSTRYRVMRKSDYTEYGYVSYEIMEDYTE